MQVVDLEEAFSVTYVWNNSIIHMSGCCYWIACKYNSRVICPVRQVSCPLTKLCQQYDKSSRVLALSTSHSDVNTEKI